VGGVCVVRKGGGNAPCVCVFVFFVCCISILFPVSSPLIIESTVLD
jgi:hypothetical protein